MSKDLAPGRYVGRAAGVPQMGGGDSPQIGVMLELLDEDGNVFDTVTFYGSLVRGAVPITLRQLRDMGWAGDDFDDWTGLGTVKVDVGVRYEEWEGKTRQKINVDPEGGGVRMAKPLDDNAKRTLTAQLKGAILQSKAVVGGPAATKPGGGYAPRRPAAPPPGAGDQWTGEGADPGGTPFD